MAVEDQIVSIFAGTNGYLDDIPAEDVQRFESELLDYVRTRKADLMQKIRDTGTLPDGDALADAVKDFGASFQQTSASAGEADVSKSSAAGAGPETSPETLETE